MTNREKIEELRRIIALSHDRTRNPAVVKMQARSYFARCVSDMGHADVSAMKRMAKMIREM